MNNNNDFNFESSIVSVTVEDPELIRKNHAKIIEAGTKLFTKKGYHNTTMREIARESTIGLGSIYQYVKNKEEILFLILEYILRQYEYRLSRSIKPEADIENKLYKSIEAYYLIVNKEYKKVVLAYAETNSLSSFYRNYIKELELKTNKIFEDILEEGVEKKIFKPIDVSLVSYNIIMFGHMWALKRWYFIKKMTIEDYIHKQIDFIRKMIIKDS